MQCWFPVFSAVLLLSCAGTTHGTGDASSSLDRGTPDEDALVRDAPVIAEDRRFDTGMDLVPPRDIQDVPDAGNTDMDAGDVRDVAEEDTTIAWDVPDAFSWDVDVPPPDRGDVQLPDGGCETLAPGPLTHRSCNPDGGAPAAHCQEVHYCGGTFTMGAAGAWEVQYEPQVGAPRVDAQMRTCDMHTATVGPGYIDAHEVTVARYRQWVLAGMPVPPSGTEIARGIVWDDARSFSARELPVRHRYNSQQAGNQETIGNLRCLFDYTLTMFNDRPVNCVQEDNALAFCWWDGMELVNETVWEYVATNRGTTSLPFGDVPAGVSPCVFADVGRVTGPCDTTVIPARIDTFPRGDTLDPAGVHNLWGGLAEITIGLSRPYHCAQPLDGRTCTSNAMPSYDGYWQPACPLQIVTRGLSFAGDAQYRSRLERVQSRQRGPRQSGDVATGFRCMRRARPPTAPP